MVRFLSATILVLLNLPVLSGCFSNDPTGSDDDITVDCNTTTPPANTAIVRISGFAFQPAELRVDAGTNVVWINCESGANPGLAHTSTSDNGVWDSPLLSPQGAGKFQRVFSQRGTFAYHCRPHDNMRARVIVE
jgi:plastocyanin